MRELVGYGMSGDAYHITAPSEDGDGAFRCMNAALKRAGISPAEIDYINAHGTSTMADGIELGAVERVVGNAAGKISMSSTKSCIGHLLGAAGAVEAIFSILAIRDQCRAADDQSGQSVGRDADRPRAAQAAQARYRRGAVEFVRLRRHQRVAGLPPRRGLGWHAWGAVHPFAIFGLNLRPTAREWT